MSVSVSLAMTLSVLETLASNVPFAASSNRDILHNGLNVSKTLNATSTPPATVVAANRLTLTAGAGQLDLRALTGTNGVAVDMNGLKVQAVLLYNPTSNANNVTIVTGTTNGYGLLGAGTNITLAPGQRVELFLNDAAPDVAAGAKTLDVSGTGAQVLDFAIVAG